MKLRTSDTIVAIATPLGVGAISIVRTSGPNAIAITERVFRGSTRLCEAPSHTMRHGRIVDTNGEVVDEVLVSVFRTPTSYTGENMAEINCHGGMFVTRKVLSVLIEAGARLADPGEFTKRAFLNGRLDLSQAEAVADLISAGSEKALKNSQAQLGGRLGDRIGKIRSDLMSTLSLLELQLDFSEEDISVASSESINSALEKCIAGMESVLSSYNLGRKLRDGASVAIVGRPNVGKSSLFNRLLMEDRSIVSSSPGTTRDFLEESVAINGMQVRLFDTAGLRESADAVEADGVERTKGIIRSSDLVILVIDSSEENTATSDLSEISAEIGSEVKVLVVGNKADIGIVKASSEPVQVYVSSVTGEGLHSLRNKVFDGLIGDSTGGEPEYCLSSSRHSEVLSRCIRHANAARESLMNGTPLEFVSSEIRIAVNAIGEISGEITTDDVLNTIFSKFCIGK